MPCIGQMGRRKGGNPVFPLRPPAKRGTPKSPLLAGKEKRKKKTEFEKKGGEKGAEFSRKKKGKGRENELLTRRGISFMKERGKERENGRTSRCAFRRGR